MSPKNEKRDANKEGLQRSSTSVNYKANEHPEKCETLSRDDGSPNGRAESGLFSREQWVTLVCVSAGTMLSNSQLGLLVTFFSLVAVQRGVSQTVAGAIFSCFALTQLAVYPVAGRLVPRVGVARSFNLGFAVSAVSTAVFGVLDRILDNNAFVAACFVTRTVEAIGFSVLTTSAYTIIANKFAERTNTAFGVIGTMQGISASLGPMLGGLLYKHGGYGLPFYVVSAVMLLGAVGTSLAMPAVKPPERLSRPLLPMLRVYVSSAEVWLCSVMAFTVAVSVTAMDPGIGPYYFSAIGVTPSELGVFLLVATGSFTVCSFGWGRIYDAIHNKYLLLTPSMVGIAVGLLLMPPSPLLVGLRPSRWLLGVGLTIQELFQCGANIPLFAKIYSICVARGLTDDVVSQAFVSSTFWVLSSMGSAIGPTVGGIIIDASSFPVMMTLLAGWNLLVAAGSAVQTVRVWRQPV